MTTYYFRPVCGSREKAYRAQREVRSHQCLVDCLNRWGIPIDMPLQIKQYHYQKATRENTWAVSLPQGGILGFLTAFTDGPHGTLTVEEFPVEVSKKQWFIDELWKQTSAITPAVDGNGTSYVGLSDERLNRLAVEQIFDRLKSKDLNITAINKLPSTIFVDEIACNQSICIVLLGHPVPQPASGKQLLITQQAVDWVVEQTPKLKPTKAMKALFNIK